MQSNGKTYQTIYWGGNYETKKIHWIGWDKLCKRKEDKGLGLRDMSLFNKSMLAKQCWNLATNPNTLMASLFKDLYHLNTPSFRLSWETNLPLIGEIKCGAKLFWTKGLRWKVGDGSQINLRKDKWLKGTTHFKLTQPHNTPPYITKVSDLIDHNTHSWNTELLN